MTDAFAEFLNENQHRAYPFVEDSNFTSVETSVLANDVILDFAAIHRLRYKTTQLLAIVGPDGGGSLEFPAVANQITFYFAFSNDADRVILSFGLSTTDTLDDVWSYIDDPEYPGVWTAKARVTFGPGAIQLASDVFWTFLSLKIEPSLTVSLYRNQTDLVKIIHLEGDDEVVGGNLSIVGGYNVDLLQADRTIRVIPTLGGGTLGRFTGSISDLESNRCSGVLLAINGQPPTERNEFFITGGKGIEIVNLPDEHKIQIRLEPAKIGETICP